MAWMAVSMLPWAVQQQRASSSGWASLPGLRVNSMPRDAGQVQVEQSDIVAVLGRQRRCLFAAAGFRHGQALPPETLHNGAA